MVTKYNDKTTQTEKLFNKLKNNRIIAVLILVGTIILVLFNFFNTTKSTLENFGKTDLILFTSENIFTNGVLKESRTFVISYYFDYNSDKPKELSSTRDSLNLLLSFKDNFLIKDVTLRGNISIEERKYFTDSKKIEALIDNRMTNTGDYVWVKLEPIRRNNLFSYKKNPYDYISRISSSEYWDGFKSFIKSSDCPDKDLVYRVIAMYSDPEIRAQEIYNIAQVPEYKSILDGTRSVDVLVTGNILEDESWLVKKAIESPTKFHEYDFLYISTLPKSIKIKIRILQYGHKLYPENEKILNNLACLLYMNGDKREAKSLIIKAISLNPNDIVISTNSKIILK